MQSNVALDRAKKFKIRETKSEVKLDTVAQIDLDTVEKKYLDAAKNWLAYCGVEIQEEDETNN